MGLLFSRKMLFIKFIKLCLQMGLMPLKFRVGWFNELHCHVFSLSHARFLLSQHKSINLRERDNQYTKNNKHI